MRYWSFSQLKLIKNTEGTIDIQLEDMQESYFG